MVFGAGAGTGRFFLKLLSVNALSNPGFSARVLFLSKVEEGEIIDICDVYEKIAPEFLYPVVHNPAINTTVYQVSDTMPNFDSQEARPAMSSRLSFHLYVMRFSFSWSLPLLLAHVLPLDCLL